MRGKRVALVIVPLAGANGDKWCLMTAARREEMPVSTLNGIGPTGIHERESNKIPRSDAFASSVVGSRAVTAATVRGSGPRSASLMSAKPLTKAALSESRP
jgi:hypothetical protein